MTQKTPKNQKLKKSKTHRRKPQIKKSENKLWSELRNIKNDILKNVKNSKITYKKSKTKKNKKITNSCKEESSE